MEVPSAAERIKLEGDEFEVRYPESTSDVFGQVEWYEIFNSQETGTRYTPDSLWSSTREFDLADNEDHGYIVWTSASTWVLYHTVLDHFESLGSEFALTDKFAVKPIHDSARSDVNEGSYANPDNMVIYIDEDEFELGTLLHELAHIWIYQHDHGTTGLVAEIIRDQDTHGWEEDENIAWHEGFAQYINEMLQVELGLGEPTTLPLARPRLNELGLHSLSTVDNHDDSWTSIFHLLTTERVYTYDFGEYFSVSDLRWPDEDTVFADPYGYSLVKNDCRVASWDLSLRDVLSVALAHPDVGLDANISKDEMTLDEYLDRAKKVLDDIGNGQLEVIKAMLDPHGDEQPFEAMDCVDSIEAAPIITAPDPAGPIAGDDANEGTGGAPAGGRDRDPPPDPLGDRNGDEPVDIRHRPGPQRHGYGSPTDPTTEFATRGKWGATVPSRLIADGDDRPGVVSGAPQPSGPRRRVRDQVSGLRAGRQVSS